MTGFGLVCRSLAIIAGICCVTGFSAALMAQTVERQVYSLGTGPTEGVSHPLGVTLAALVKLKLLPEADIDVDAQNTAGSGQNARLLRSNALDFAIISGFDAYHAARGTGPFSAEDADPNLRFVTNLWTSSFHFIVRLEDSSSGTLTDFLNLEGRSIALGRNGSDLRNQAEALFDALDVSIADTFQLENLNERQAAVAFLQGDIDGFLLVDNSQGDEIADFLETAEDQAIVLDISDDQIEAIGGRDALPWTRIDLPANTLPRQTGEHVTVGLHNLLGTHEQVAEETVNQITKTIFDNLPFLQEMHSATIGINLETALDQLSLPVHAGAASYYDEVGVTLPEPAPIRISTLSQTPFLNRYRSIEEARTRLSESTFTVLSGEEGQTTTRMISELANHLGDTGIRVVGMITPKPTENIADVLYARGVDSAIVPLNIMNYARAENVYPDVRRKIAYATELFTEEVHLIVSDAVDDLEDLIARPVNLGPPGSTSEFTSSFLLDQRKIPIEPTYHDHRTALALLAEGKIAGAFIVSGKPAPALADIPKSANLRLLTVPALAGEAYRPATLSSDDYPNLLATGEDVETFALRTMLLSYNWRPDNQRFDVLSTFLDRFFDRLPALQQSDGGFHAKWQEINPFRGVQGWIRSPAAENWLRKQDGSAGGSDNTDG